MKLWKVIRAREAFYARKDVKLPAAIAYKIFKFCKEVDGDAFEFYREKLNDTIKEFAIDVGGGQYQVPEEKQAAFTAAMAEIDELDVKAPDIAFTLQELDGLELSIADMAGLEDFLKEE